MSIVLFILVSSIILSTNWAQTKLANAAVSWVNESFNLRADIGAVEISFPNKVRLKDVFLADDHHDTLIYLSDLRTTILGFNRGKKLLHTSNVALNNVRLYMRKHQEDSLFNFKLFLNKLAQTENTDSVTTPFQWKSTSIEVDSLRFIKHRLGCSNDSCTNIFIDYAKISITDFHLNGNEVKANIKSFNYIDRHRFDLLKLNALVEYQSQFLSVEGLKIKTEKSDFEGDIRLEYTSNKDFLDFVNQVKIKSDLRSATISSDEFRQWLDEFPDFGDFTAQLKLQGTTNNLEVTDALVTLGNGTRYQGDVTVINSTHAKDIFIDATMKNFHMLVSDYNSYIAPISNYIIPERLAVLNHLNVNGKYKGNLKDIDLTIEFQTKLGNGNLDLLLSNVNQPDELGYKGFIDLQNFALGVFLDNKTIGYTSFNGNVDGKGTTVNTLDFGGDMNVEYIDVNNYRFTGIDIDGRTSDSIFTGIINIDDSNLIFDLEGLIDFKSQKKAFDFTSNLKYANLFALGISKDSISEVSSKFVSKMNIDSDNDFNGIIKVNDITYANQRNFYFFDSLTIASNYSKKGHELKLNSQLLNATLNGSFKLSDIVPSFKHVVGSLYKHYKKEEASEEIVNDFKYFIEFNNTELLAELFVPELYINPGTSINGHLELPNQDFELQVSSSLIKYKKTTLEELDINLTNEDYLGNLNIDLGSYKYDNVSIDSSEIDLVIFNDSVDFQVKTIIKDSIDSYVNIKGNSLNKRKDFYEISLFQSRFNIGFQNFEIVGNNKISWFENEVYIDNIFFKSDESNLAINGILSDNRNEILRFSLDSLNMNILNYFIGNKNTRIAGFMNGDVMLSQVFSSPKVISDFTADSLVINNNWVGDAKIESDWNYERNRFEFESNIKRGLLPSFELIGFYKPDSNEYIRATADFTRFRVNAFNPLLSGILSDLRGSISGNMVLDGPLSSPSFKGKLKLSQVAMRVPYLQTDYNIVGQPEIEIVDTSFILPIMDLMDTKEGTKGQIVGSINHKAFQDFNFNLKLNADKLFAMNLEKGENDYFFGKAYVSGDMTIKGPVKDIELDLNIKTEKGTEFNLPITSNVEVQRNSFITFVHKKDDYANLLQDLSEEVELRGLNLKLNIEILPVAIVRLIMDETVGDIIKAQGEGQIRVEMKPNGEIEMFGDYEVHKGDYLFTMRNLLNKPFILESGSTMSWKGNPYNANINLRSKYTTRTNLTGIVTSPDYTGQRVNVDLYLKLTGVLENPTISFKIDLPESPPSWQDELDNKMTNIDRLNQQAFSLLMLNTFWVEGGPSVTPGQGVTTNTTQMLFSQFSNWISAGTDFIDVNMNYSTSNQDNYRDELEIALSKNFYDDRITVNGVLDVPIGSTPGSTPDKAATQSLTGDVEVLYKLTEDGRVKTKAFNRSNQNNPTRSHLAPYTQGIGILYSRDFETWGGLFKMFFTSKKKEQEKQKAAELEKEKE